MSGLKVIVKESCADHEAEQLVRYMQDTLGWTEGVDFMATRSTDVVLANEGDQLHTCNDCGSPFTFTVGEQVYYSRNNLQPPKRCPECRKKRRTFRERPDGRDGSAGHSRPDRRTPSRYYEETQ